MSDKLSQLGQSINEIKGKVEDALRRDHPVNELTERGRDIFDPVEPFKLDFYVPENISRVHLNMLFQLPPDQCCAGVICGICETYTTSGPWRTTYPMIRDSVRIIASFAGTFGYEEYLLTEGKGDDWYFINDNTVNASSYGGTVDYPIKICYSYNTLDPRITAPGTPQNWDITIDNFANRIVPITTNEDALGPSSSGADIGAFISEGSYVEIADGLAKFHFQPYYINNYDAELEYDISNVFTIGDIPNGIWSMNFKFGDFTSTNQHITVEFIVTTRFDEQFDCFFDGDVINATQVRGNVHLSTDLDSVTVANQTFTTGILYKFLVESKNSTITLSWGPDGGPYSTRTINSRPTPWEIDSRFAGSFDSRLDLLVFNDDNLQGVDGNQSKDFIIEIGEIRFQET